MNNLLNFPRTFPVTAHTDYVGKGSTFVVIRGTRQDGQQFIPLALERGATTLVLEKGHALTAEITALVVASGATVDYVADTRKALATLSAQAAGNPAEQLKIIAVTGTKGKSSTVFTLEHILRSAGHVTALVSTVKNSINGNDLPTDYTTPQPDYLHQFLRACVEQKVTHVVMEVAAQALTMSRVYGITFDAAIFTNFALEHLEFYETIEDYFAAKCLLFKQLKPHAPVYVNADDTWGQSILKNHQTFKSFGVSHLVGAKRYDKQAYDCNVIYHNTQLEPLVFDVVWQHQAPFRCQVNRLLGEFNAYNCAGVVAVAREFGVKPEAIVHALATFPGIPGRLTRYMLPNGATCFVDYAHNPSSFETVLKELQQLSSDLIVVFGAGGQRDKSKRPLMGAIAAHFAHRCIITSDNPRNEEPLAIMQDILVGVAPEDQHKVIMQVDRAAAIKEAYALSKPHSVIAVLGKGPDEYQLVGTQRIPFSDGAVVQSLQ